MLVARDVDRHGLAQQPHGAVAARLWPAVRIVVLNRLFARRVLARGVHAQAAGHRVGRRALGQRAHVGEDRLGDGRLHPRALPVLRPRL